MSKNITFEEFCYDFRDLAPGLLEGEFLLEVRQDYKAFISTPWKTDVAEKHPDAGLKLAELKEKTTRLISSAEYSINKHGETLNVVAAIALVADAKAVFSGRATKAQLLELITRNSDVSRDLNNQLVAFNAKKEG